ncbi:MAG: racemase [Candidatus Pelagibacter sp. TMED273]|nr:MAG: racemase [Candidatus Pelagibacter sp. TMED273]|tara:strand:- start:1287 stop:2033 length:747 start_codon:yes stop_codon:yes gene_type:complete
MRQIKIRPKFNKIYNPRIGLITLATDFVIEKDFKNVIKNKNIDFFVNRITCYNPLTKNNLLKMSLQITQVTRNILPNEKIDCVVYGCTSGTIASGFKTVERKIKLAKPKTKVTTPSSAAIKALKKLKIKKISVFTPYSKKLNNEVLQFFKQENFEITSNSYMDIRSDSDIWKIDKNYLYDKLSKLELNNAEALFVSCTALPILELIEKLEKKLNKIVLSSNQVLIWDALENIGRNKSIKGFGSLFKNN